MLWLKGCPRCNGDLHQDRDLYGEYIACLQCGYYLNLLEEIALYYSARLSVVGEEEIEDRVLVAASA